jgi:hypothetical protein
VSLSSETLKQLHCCGVANFTDWRRHAEFDEKGYPRSCCPGLGAQVASASSGSTGCTEQSDGFYRGGCFAKLVSVVEDDVVVLGGVGLAVAIVEVINYPVSALSSFYYFLEVSNECRIIVIYRCESPDSFCRMFQSAKFRTI